MKTVPFALIDDDNRLVYLTDIDESIAHRGQEHFNVDLNLGGTWIDLRNHQNVKGSVPPIGSTYIPEANLFVLPKPFPSWSLNEAYDWVAPKPVDIKSVGLPGENLPEWDEERQNWRHPWFTQVLSQDTDSDDGFFFIHRSVDTKTLAESKDLFAFIPESIPCLFELGDYEYAHPDFEPGFIDPMFRPGSYASAFGADPLTKGIDGLTVFRGFSIVYDGAPYFFIAYARLADITRLNEDGSVDYSASAEFEDLFRREHPQRVGRTLGELFRLIIEWDLAYHYFGNRENIAIICHNIMATIRMPDEIYDQIVESFADQAVAKYIRGDESALDLSEPRNPTPEPVREWFVNKYWELRHRLSYDTFNVGEADDNHYRL